MDASAADCAGPPVIAGSWAPAALLFVDLYKVCGGPPYLSRGLKGVQRWQPQHGHGVVEL